MKTRSFLLVSVLLLFPFVLSGQTNQGGVLKAGFSKIDITPSQPVMLYGYASRKTPSEGVHDPLSVRVAVFENNGSRVLFISSDLGSFSAEVFPVIQHKLIEKFNFTESEIFVSTIHDHSSPILTLDRETGSRQMLTTLNG